MSEVVFRVTANPEITANQYPRRSVAEVITFELATVELAPVKLATNRELSHLRG